MFSTTAWRTSPSLFVAGLYRAEDAFPRNTALPVFSSRSPYHLALYAPRWFGMPSSPTATAALVILVHCLPSTRLTRDGRGAAVIVACTRCRPLCRPSLPAIHIHQYSLASPPLSCLALRGLFIISLSGDGQAVVVSLRRACDHQVPARERYRLILTVRRGTTARNALPTGTQLRVVNCRGATLTYGGRNATTFATAAQHAVCMLNRRYARKRLALV